MNSLLDRLIGKSLSNTMGSIRVDRGWSSYGANIVTSTIRKTCDVFEEEGEGVGPEAELSRFGNGKEG